jgi:hypothetical protein
MKKIAAIIGGLLLLSASFTPVLAFEGQFNPNEALKINQHPVLAPITVKTVV